MASLSCTRLDVAIAVQRRKVRTLSIPLVRDESLLAAMWYAPEAEVLASLERLVDTVSRTAARGMQEGVTFPFATATRQAQRPWVATSSCVSSRVGTAGARDRDPPRRRETTRETTFGRCVSGAATRFVSQGCQIGRPVRLGRLRFVTLEAVQSRVSGARAKSGSVEGDALPLAAPGTPGGQARLLMGRPMRSTLFCLLSLFSIASAASAQSLGGRVLRTDTTGAKHPVASQEVILLCADEGVLAAVERAQDRLAVIRDNTARKIEDAGTRFAAGELEFAEMLRLLGRFSYYLGRVSDSHWAQFVDAALHTTRTDSVGAYRFTSVEAGDFIVATRLLGEREDVIIANVVSIGEVGLEEDLRSADGADLRAYFSRPEIDRGLAIMIGQTLQAGSSPYDVETFLSSRLEEANQAPIPDEISIPFRCAR